MATHVTNAIDLNAADTSTLPVSAEGMNRAALQVSLESGSIGSTVVTLEGSIDGVKYTTATTQTGEGVTSAADVTRFGQVRARVSTAAGSTATGTIAIVTKNVPVA